ncbi:hypothetical protein NQ315_016228 [Exocentrus adspersus]|uniref:Uncharacterized protein n=1 Tax=Exocentrus adspersus TaxID=1586481 RepID=A0AAV8VJH1_9CUCU|nr:hypothetical protein NQ315_016228 [Exocentrus adspersus]
MDVIQHELDKVAFEWNTHRIRASRNSNAPTGRPMCLFELSHLFGGENCLVHIPEGIVDVIQENENFTNHNNICDEDA